MVNRLHSNPYLLSAPEFAGGKPVEVVQAKLGLKKGVKLASNENLLGPSPRAIAALCAAQEDAHLGQ